MINTAKKAGNGLTINGGGKWLANTHPAVIEYLEEGGIVEDEFTPEELETQRISEIKAEAKSLILNGMSEEEQRNSLAELIAVLYSAMVDPTILQNPVVVEEANTRVEAWKRVGAIRDVSNKKEKGEDVVWPT